jgi:ribosome silencing factor RsfS/YbeB/iojap
VVPDPHRHGRRIIARKPTAESGKSSRAAGTDTKRRAPQPVTSLAEAAKAPGTPRKKAVVAGPQDSATVRRVRKAERVPVEPDVLEKYLGLITESLADDKGENIVVLDLVGRSSFADRMVIATGLADRQISAMATHIETKLAEAGLKRIRIEGAGGSDWVLLDAGDIVVHLFKPEARALYALERMWGAELDEPATVAGPGGDG